MSHNSERWMKAATYIILAALLPLVLGCTPMGENALRKLKTDAPAEIKPRAQIEQPAVEPRSVPRLDYQTRMTIQEYGPTIKSSARRYGFDWRLIMAVMRTESAFVPDAQSPAGAQGLMQIMPATGEELAGKLELENLDHPGDNIRGGIYYLRQLYRFFEGVEDEEERLKLTLAAYNAGISRVYDAQELSAYIQDDPGTWKAVRNALPLLSKRYYTLHSSVWQEGKPRGGWFGGSRETIAYVETVMRHYDTYRLVLN